MAPLRHKKKRSAAIAWISLLLLAGGCSGLTAKTGHAPEDPEKLFRQGMQYSMGDTESGVPVDRTKGLALIRQSSQLGYLPAVHTLAWAYLEGHEVDRDVHQAFQFFQTAAEQGHADSQYMLGVLYLEGSVVDKDGAMGLNWIKKAADQGHAQARNALSGLFRPPPSSTQ